MTHDTDPPTKSRPATRRIAQVILSLSTVVLVTVAVIVILEQTWTRLETTVTFMRSDLAIAPAHRASALTQLEMHLRDNELSIPAEQVVACALLPSHATDGALHAPIATPRTSRKEAQQLLDLCTGYCLACVLASLGEEGVALQREVGDPFHKQMALLERLARR